MLKDQRLKALNWKSEEWSFRGGIRGAANFIIMEHSSKDRKLKANYPLSLAARAVFVRAIGGRVLRAEANATGPIFEVEEDPLLYGFNFRGGLGESLEVTNFPRKQEFGKFPVSWIRRMAIAQTGIAYAGAIALEGVMPPAKLTPKNYVLPGDDDGMGASPHCVLSHFAKILDADMQTCYHMHLHISVEVRKTVFENWQSVRSYAMHISDPKQVSPQEVIDADLLSRPFHPYQISAEHADLMWSSAERAMEVEIQSRSEY